MKDKALIKYVWTISMVLCIALFVSNLDQASRNMQGVKWSIVLSIALLINCISRVVYWLLKKDYAVRISNGVGVITSAIVIATYFMY